MKKRIFSLFLLLALLVTAMPATAVVGAEENIQVPTEVADVQTEKKLSAYDERYVGADGSKTANGGQLVSLFSAFNNDPSVNLTDGLWINKLSDQTASFGNLEYWERRADGSVGYTGFYGQLQADGSITKSASTNNISAGASSFTGTRLDFGLDLLPKDDYTIEYAARYMPIYVADANGDIALDGDGNPMEYYKVTGNGVGSSNYAGPIDAIGFITSWSVSRDGAYSSYMPNRGDIIWMHHEDGKSAWGASYNWLGSGPWGAGGLRAPNIRESGAIHTFAMSRDEEQTVDIATGTAAIEATYAIHRDATTYNSVQLSTASTVKGYEYFETDDQGYFYLSSMLPTDFYSVRIYTAALTTAEMQHNNFIDMAAYAAADLNDFLALDAVTQSLVEGLMAGQDFPEDAAAFAAALENAVDLYRDPVTPEDTLYVQDGLRVLTTAYKNMHTGALAVGDSAISWFNAAQIGESINVKGKGWQLRADGGYYMIKDYAEFSKDRNFGLYLTPEMLPEDDYTVEMILNPTGIVAYEEDGTYTRHIDEQTTYGYNYEHGFSIGPLRCLIFPSAAVGGSRSGMEKWWCYNSGNRMWNGLDTAGRRQLMTEDAWQSVDVNDVISYTISLDKDVATDSQIYRISMGGEIVNSATLSLSSGYTNEEANNMFQLMCYHPGGVFSVRVYDRVLTEAERDQNHLADLLYFYDVDPSSLLTDQQEMISKIAALTADVAFVLDPAQREETKAYLQGLVDLSTDSYRHTATVEISPKDVYTGHEVTVSLRLTGKQACSLAVTPSFDSDCFELVAARWTLTDTVLSHIEAGTLRSVAVLAEAQDLDGVVYTLTLRPKKAVTASISFAVTVEDVVSKTVLTVTPADIPIMTCLHSDLCYTPQGDATHVVSCRACSEILATAAHTFDSLCDQSCDLCGYTDSVTRGHIAEDATCIVPSICERCDELVADALGHDLLPATCDLPIRCSRCSYKRGTALGHDMRDATCTLPATCSRCDHTEGEALGHDMQDATCTSPSACSRCDHTEGEALGHDLQDATCTLPATCSRCGHTEGEALGHDMLDVTCTEVSTCSRCGHTEGEALGHDMQDATCTLPATCSRCDHTEGEPLGHDPAAATCTEAAFCRRCGESQGEALGHAWGDWQVTILPTYVVDGTETCVCENDASHKMTRAKIHPDLIKEWSCGTGVFARLYPDSEAGKYALHVFGTGEMEDYTAATLPWAAELPSIATVTVYAGVTSIGASAFRGAASLAAVTIAESVGKIGDSAFRACESLAFVSPLANVRTIGKYAFYGCSALPALTFGNGATLASVGVYAFSACDRLQRIALNNATAIAGLTDYDVYGYLLAVAETVLLPKSGVTVPAYITEVYPETAFVWQDGTAYIAYATHSHAEDSSAWEEDACTVCGLVKEGKPLLAGDIDCDMIVDIADIVAVISLASGNVLDPTQYPGQGDLTNDAIIDIADIVAVIAIASGDS